MRIQWSVLVIIILFANIPLFAQSVDTAWVRTYNGPGNLVDWATLITVDDSGNIYVTGVSQGSGTGEDYGSIKYDSNGNELWVRRYNGSANYFDWPFAIAVDGSGNVYVAGMSIGNGTSWDYATIKYDPNGNELWAKRYNGAGNSGDHAYAMTVDVFGNVYVTGGSKDSVTLSDYTTVKYDGAGNELWVKRYNGPGNQWDDAYAIAVDDSGEVYVSGKSMGSGTSNDYATIKYDSSGNELWVRRYNGPGNADDGAYAITVDGRGHIYVTGSSHGGETLGDYATIKYGQTGNQLWLSRYNGLDNLADGALALSVDDSGNVSVTGASAGSGTGKDFATVKYDAFGDELWAKRYNGPANDWDEARSIAVDHSGNVYVTGWSIGKETLYEFATIKYSPNGDTTWMKRYSGQVGGGGVAYDLAVDSFGNVYVAGLTDSPGTHSDYATIKYVQFVRGDVNNNDEVTIADVVYLLNYLLKSGAAPIPAPIVGDANCDSKVDISDAVYLVNHLFKDGPSPCI